MNLETTVVIYLTWINYQLNRYLVVRTVLTLGFDCDEDKLADLLFLAGLKSSLWRGLPEVQCQYSGDIL